MKKHYAMWLLASGFLVSACLASCHASAAGRDPTAPTDSRLDMVAVLQAMDTHPSLGEQAKVFGRLVGTWDGEYTEFAKDGSTTRLRAEYHMKRRAAAPAQ
jgi:hypothetical protein